MRKKEFEKLSLELLDESQKILVLLRRPNSGNSKHYVFIENKEDFKELLDSCNHGDSLSVFKSFNEICNGVVTDNFINESLHLVLEETSFTEVIILEDSYLEFKTKGYAEWQVVESVDEFKEVLTENLGTNISVIIEPEFWKTEKTFHLYVPDEKGISKSGGSY